MCPERHLDAAAMLGNEGMNNKKEDAGLILADMVRNIMDVMKVPDGLSALNYTIDDVPALVAGAIPQVKFFFTTLAILSNLIELVIIHTAEISVFLCHSFLT